MEVVNLSIWDTWKIIEPAYNNKLEIFVPTWNDEFNLPDHSYSITQMQYYFEYFIKKYKNVADNPPIQVSVHKIKNRIIFKIKTGYKWQLLSPETMKLLVRGNPGVDKNG